MWINPTVFGTLLLISSCHSASLGDSTVNGGESIAPVDANVTKPLSNKIETDDDTGEGIISSLGQRVERCFGFFKRLVGLEEEILQGNPNDVRFFLYPSPADKQYAEEIRFGKVGYLEESNFRVGLPLKIIIHGWTKNHVSETVQIIKEAYLRRMVDDSTGQSPNIVLVDWEPIANPKVGEFFSYKYAVANVPLVGRRVGEFIQFLIENGAVSSLRDVHIIGFSLGAHIAGHAGSTLRQLNAGQLPARVTGLDPAGPAFYEGLTFSHRHLHKTDARFVDVIHTSMGTLGTLDALGHADFYPNGGGPVQHRCEVEYDQHIAKEGNGNSTAMSRLSDISSCSHGQAPEFFALSILNPRMIGCRCESYIHFKMGCECVNRATLGEYCETRSKGKFYLDV